MQFEILININKSISNAVIKFIFHAMHNLESINSVHTLLGGGSGSSLTGAVATER
jgi:hypothetical protein